jgi:hypothetical protein
MSGRWKLAACRADEARSWSRSWTPSSTRLVDEVIARSEEIERGGLVAYASADEAGLEETFETLLTGLAVRYYKAVAG